VTESILGEFSDDVAADKSSEDGTSIDGAIKIRVE